MSGVMPNQQLEGPESPRPSGPPPTVVRRYDVERSCIRCHERKVRCNKTTPCMTCVRAKATCRYPGPERTKRRSQKTTSARVGPRLEVLERAVASFSHTGSSVPGQTAIHSRSVDPPTFSPNTPAAPGPSDTENSGGFLLKEGSSTRYINEFTFSRVLEKVCDVTNRPMYRDHRLVLTWLSEQQGELQSAIDTPTSESTSSSHGQLPAINFDGLISNPYLSNDILSLYPSRWQATQLWQNYLNNVDSLVKILHVPTLQPKIFAAINNPKDTPHDMNALLFAIYFAAVTSLRSPDIHIILGQDRQAALGAYQRGLEVSLHMGSFLDSPTIVSIQAIAIYLVRDVLFQLHCILVVQDPLVNR